VKLVPWIQTLRVVTAVSLGKPWSLAYFANREMRNALKARLAEQDFDLIFVYCSSMAPYVEHLKLPPKILDFVDSDACKWDQYATAKNFPANWLYRYEAKRLKDFEVRMLDCFECCTFVSPREAAHIPDQTRARVMFIPNGVDLDSFAPTFSDPVSRTIVFTGTMDYFPNVDAVTFFTLEVLPKIRQVFSDARFMIVGSRPVQSVRKLASLPGVTVTGTVQDVRPFIGQARIAVAPLRISQGIQNKVLEALATGLPVVASPTAAAGFQKMEHVPLVLAESPTAFADVVCDLLRRPPLGPEQVRLCREQLRLHYDWATNLAVFDQIIRQFDPFNTAPADTIPQTRMPTGRSASC